MDNRERFYAVFDRVALGRCEGGYGIWRREISSPFASKDYGKEEFVADSTIYTDGQGAFSIRFETDLEKLKTV